MADTVNPLLKALPPETDYISYLTILEYNLAAEQLPTLHTILQDETLTANIGWDLVHLLLPLLPTSQQCLQDVSRLGNPREVVLKVTELLEGIGHENEDEDGIDMESEGEEAEETGETVPKKLEELTREDIEVQNHEERTVEIAGDPKRPKESPSKALRFSTLLGMLSILHPRIKTKYPSRFLSTSLQAILPAYIKLAHHAEVTESILAFIKDLSGTKRPKLPPRKSSSVVPLQSTPQSAPDPEGQDEVLSAEEASLQSRLLQSFLTYVTEGYMTSLAAGDDTPGLAWSTRYQEKSHPEKIVPGRRTFSSLFAEKENLHERDAMMGHILALVRDLRITLEELLTVIMKPETAQDGDENEQLPSTASDIPLSRTGSLYLLATMGASFTFFNAPASLPPLTLIPDFAAILSNTLGDPLTGNSIGTEPAPLIDAILFLGFLILHRHGSTIATTSDDEEAYTAILQRLSLLSANTPSPTLRYTAHILTSSLLHSNPSPSFRLSFIRDTLEYCPFENLRVSAVEWLKDELLAASRPAQVDHRSDATEQTNKDDNIFATPAAAFSTLSPFLFPNLDTLVTGESQQQSTTTAPPTSTSSSYNTLQAHQPFYLAVLNLLYLIFSSPSLSSHSSFYVSSKADPNHLDTFLSSLSAASRRYRTGILSDEIRYGDNDDEERKGTALAGLELLDMAVEQVEDALSRIRHA